MHVHDDLAHSEPSARLRELASVLAAGILRLRSRAALPGVRDQVVETKKSQEFSQDCLEVLAETVLSVHGG